VRLLLFIIHSHIKLLYDNIDTILTFKQEYLIRQMAQYNFSLSYIVVHWSDFALQFVSSLTFLIKVFIILFKCI